MKTESYVLERMRMAALEKRLDNFLKTDWKSKAADLLAERLATGQGEVRFFLYWLSILSSAYTTHAFTRYLQYKAQFTRRWKA